MSRGLFITFEGPDGSGKSTQFRRLAERLLREGYQVIESAEPGGSDIGRQIRRILLDPANQDLTATAELLLMFAARAQNVEQVILPALAEGKIVLSDRFTDSTLAYQGAARGLGDAVVRQIHEIACRGLDPDLTLCIDIDAEAGLARADHRNRNATGHAESRLDQQTLEFHQKARAAYHDLARAEPRRFRLIDGQGTSDAVALRVWSEVEPQLAMRS
jgi:dTMP kinase